MNTRRRLEQLLEGLPYDQDPTDYFDTPDQLLQPLMICYDSLVWKTSIPFTSRHVPTIFNLVFGCTAILWVGNSS